MQTSKKVIIFQLLRSQGEPLDAVVDYLLRRQCRQVSDIARTAGVHRDYVRRLIKGERNTNGGLKAQRVKQIITAALGFDPWDATTGE